MGGLSSIATVTAPAPLISAPWRSTQLPCSPLQHSNGTQKALKRKTITLKQRTFSKDELCPCQDLTPQWEGGHTVLRPTPLWASVNCSRNTRPFNIPCSFLNSDSWHAGQTCGSCESSKTSCTSRAVVALCSSLAGSTCDSITTRRSYNKAFQRQLKQYKYRNKCYQCLLTSS